MIYYKIRNKITGHYLLSPLWGLKEPIFGKRGIMWSNMNRLREHLQTYESMNGFKDCELVRFTESTNPAKITLETLVQEREKELVVKKLIGKQ